jgi:preprotein translocase subunit SecA
MAQNTVIAPPQGVVAWLRSLFAGRSARRLAAWSQQVARVAELDPQRREESDSQLRKASLSLRYRCRSGEPLERILPEAYSLVREAARRTLDMRHFDVQIVGGIALFNGSIAEMETGEGKTLTATLPLYLRALAGKGAHLATVNDYLARRDAEWMSPVYKLLGLSVGVIQSQMPPEQRAKEYAADITYGTAKEFGFDFLRDRLLLRKSGGATGLLASRPDRSGGGDQPVQREPHFALVDEADSILIDEARTPLIISALPGESQRRAVATYEWSASVTDLFVEGEHYEYDEEKRKIELTLGGCQLARSLPKPEPVDGVPLLDIYHYVERALKVARDFHRDRNYVVRDDEIVIVDEFTGRLSEGRKWSAGVHQAVEAKEKVKVTVESGHAARITVQDLFLRYRYLAGMTGTAASSAGELRKIYHLDVVVVPTNRPIRRWRQPDAVYATAEAKWMAIVEEVRALNATGRPVLIGTRTIDKSELLSRLLTASGIEHQVLNARHVAEEAEIVALAGEPGKVTVATNMAGRGTDIRLGPGVAELGGLHVICTEMHDSARIDRQLAGRCGRQGDPGTIRQYLALDDDILRVAYGPEKSQRLRAAGTRASGSLGAYTSLFRKAQRQIESRHYRDRNILLFHESERKKLLLEIGQDPYLDMPE